MGDICYKPKGSCPSCTNYGSDPESSRMSCLARLNARQKANGNVLLEDYLTATAMDDTSLAQALYPRIFTKKGTNSHGN